MSQSCQTCGACCATFRVSFYWAETDAHPDGRVPEHLTTPISPHHVAMRGSERPSPRCAALEGDIGRSVNCAIYPLRSSTCREFDAGSDACARARLRHGLSPMPGEKATDRPSTGSMPQASAPEPIAAEAIRPVTPTLPGASHAPIPDVARLPVHPPGPRGGTADPMGAWQGDRAAL